MNKTPEQKARDHIDKLLEQAGWVVVDMTSLNWSVGPGIAIREYKTTSGHSLDYALFVDRKPVGIIEAKKEEDGHKISTHEDQAEGYAKSKLKWFDDIEFLPFHQKEKSDVL